MTDYVPMLFARLLETITDQPCLVQEIRTLLQRKISGDELAEGPAIPLIQEFIDNELARMETLGVDSSRPRIDHEELNQVFRETLRRAWS